MNGVDATRYRRVKAREMRKISIDRHEIPEVKQDKETKGLE